MPQGDVKWFDSKKGFGFIINPEGKDVFVHFTSIEGDGFRSLKDGEPVDYEQVEGEKGLLAHHVRRVASAVQVARPAYDALTNRIAPCAARCRRVRKRAGMRAFYKCVALRFCTFCALPVISRRCLRLLGDCSSAAPARCSWRRSLGITNTGGCSRSNAAPSR